jgi:hypothetical protein
MSKEEVCKKLKEYIADEDKAVADYSALGRLLREEISAADSDLFDSTFFSAIISDEMKHAALLRTIARIAGCG